MDINMDNVQRQDSTRKYYFLSVFPGKYPYIFFVSSKAALLIILGNILST